jgi:hypothetical protein
MPVQDEIVTILKATTQTDAGNRVSFDRQRDMPTLPFLLLTETGGEAYRTHGGPDEFRQLTITVSAVASTGIAARTLIEQVRDKLDGYTGDLTGINHILAAAEPVASSEESASVFQATQDFRVYYYA